VSAGVAGWAAARGLEVADLEAAGFALRNGKATCQYVHADGRTAERRFDLSVSDGGWCWAPGARAKGAVLPLGDPPSADMVVIGEGESDGLRAWRLLRHARRMAVLVVPGASMVEDIANFIGNNSVVVIATDADADGDRCAAACHKDLVGAGVAPAFIRRLRPQVPGRDKPDLRDLLDHLGWSVSI
jgi:hypothetical protein